MDQSVVQLVIIYLMLSWYNKDWASNNHIMEQLVQENTNVHQLLYIKHNPDLES